MERRKSSSQKGNKIQALEVKKKMENFFFFMQKHYTQLLRWKNYILFLFIPQFSQ
jgi:hypothetical protein